MPKINVLGVAATGVGVGVGAIGVGVGLEAGMLELELLTPPHPMKERKTIATRETGNSNLLLIGPHYLERKNTPLSLESGCGLTLKSDAWS